MVILDNLGIKFIKVQKIYIYIYFNIAVFEMKQGVHKTQHPLKQNFRWHFVRKYYWYIIEAVQSSHLNVNLLGLAILPIGTTACNSGMITLIIFVEIYFQINF